VRRKPAAIPVMSPMPAPLPTNDQHTFLRFLRNLHSSSPGADVVHTNEQSPGRMFLCLLTFAVDWTVSLQFPATLPLPRPLNKPDGNVSGDFHHCIFNSHSSSLNHLPPNPSTSILPQPSNPPHIDYQLDGLFRHRQLSPMFFTLR
jgi:hypothetical protein